MLIHLSDVLTEEGKCRTYEIPMNMKTVSYHGQDCEVIGDPVMQLTLMNQGNYEVALKLTGSFETRIPCDRCLEETLVSAELDVDTIIDCSEQFIPSTDVAEDEELPELQTYVTELHLDTDVLLKQEVPMVLPQKVLCQEDCKGICSQCGTNLNHSSCSCDEAPKDLRMAAILDIFNEFQS